MNDLTRKEKMLKCRDNGLSYQAIGALFGVSRQRIQVILSDYSRLNKSLAHKNGWYNKLRIMVLMRDDSECQMCGSIDRLIIHHLDKDDNNNEINNLITLCSSCHLSIHRHEEDGNLERLAEAEGRPLETDG